MILALLLVALLGQQPASARIAAGASIGGVVLSDDPTPRPLRHARVELTGARSASAITGDDGAFAFGGLPAGRYELSAEKLGVGRRVYSANLSAEAATTIVVVANQSLSGLRVVLPRGAVIAGMVTDAGGAPVAGALVEAIARSSSAQMGVARVSAETDDEGHYRLFGISPGEYVLLASPRMDDARDVFVPIPVDTYYPSAGSAHEATTIAVAAREERLGVDISARLARPVALAGSVRDADGQPVDATVWLSHAQDADARDARAIKATGGRFRIESLAPGSYRLRATDVGRSFSSGVPSSDAGRSFSSGVPSSDVGRSFSSGVEVDVAGPEEVSVALVLEPAPPDRALTDDLAKSAADRWGALAGRLTHASGAGAPETAIVVIGVNGVPHAIGAGAPIIVWPDTNGDWSVARLAAGDYRIAALAAVTAADLARPDYLQAVVEASVAARVTAGETTTLNLQIK